MYHFGITMKVLFKSIQSPSSDAKKKKEIYHENELKENLQLVLETDHRHQHHIYNPDQLIKGYTVRFMEVCETYSVEKSLSITHWLFIRAVYTFLGSGSTD